MSLELSLRRSPLDPWLGVVLRVGAQSGCGLGLGLAGVAVSAAAFAFDVTGLGLLVALGLCGLALPMTTLPLFALLFLRLGGRKLTVTETDVVLGRTDGSELSRASLESVHASVRRGTYEAWGRRGLVLHLGVGPRAIAIGTVDREGAARRGWIVASPPELECSPAELDAFMRAIGLDAEPPR
jgi:hypothetical protein